MWLQHFPRSRGLRSVARRFSAGSQKLHEGLLQQSRGDATNALQCFRAVAEQSPPLAQAAHNAEGLLLRHPSAAAPAPAADGTLGPMPGQKVLAPWAEDGFEYEAALENVDEAADLCTVAWADGGETCRVVPRASVTTLEGVSFPIDACEQRLWAARRSLRRALLEWQQQAEAGVAHDAFVDFAGVASDLAAAELRVGLRTGAWPGLQLAQSLLRRASFTAERAYAPDPRALAALVAAKVEAMRMETGVEPKDLQLLHLRLRDHLHAATWKKQSYWTRFGGQLGWETLHQVLWAKALAHAATAKVQKAPSSKVSGIRHRSRLPRRSAWALPEKLLPAAPGLPRGQDPLLAVPCPARQGALRAWRALRWAAGRDVQRVRLPWTYSQESARNFAAELPKLQVHTELLLEVAVLIFAMGCRLGQARRSRQVALQLLMVAQSYPVDKELAEVVQHNVELLSGKDLASPQSEQMSSKALSLGRWQLLGYHPQEELWLLRRRRRCAAGGQAVANLPAMPPGSWMLEGVALAELIS